MSTHEIPQSDLAQLARLPAPIGNGTTVGAQPVARSILPDLPDCLRRWWPGRRGMKRLSYASWSYKGYIIRRNGRGVFVVERVPGVRSCFTDEFPTLWRARSFVDWLAKSKTP